MATTTTTLTLGTSNVRGSSSKTRNLPARTSRNPRSTVRQNSLVSVPTSAQGAPQPENEPHGFYPAIQHFTDAIAALPRDFRRHNSLLKEVDAKAWALEENLQKLIGQCIQERQNYKYGLTTQTVAGSVSSVVGYAAGASTIASVAGNVLDTASQFSSASVDHEVMRRRRMYAELRQNLMQMIMPLDEKNHVINNANDELSRHIRRQDEIWPHIADEISEETRLGSLRHWALIDLNPTKKTVATNARGREILNPDNEVAERSERRREAMLAKSKKTTAQLLDSDAEARKPTRKTTNKKVQDAEDAAAALPPMVQINNVLPNAKATVNRGTARRAVDNAMKKFGPGAAVGGASMSRENSQQDNVKKRKAPPAATTARKRYVNPIEKWKPANKSNRVNASAQDAPKLAQSPLLGTFKEAHKKSPALSVARPVSGRGRQNSAQQGEPSGRPASTASRRNGVTAAGTEMERVTTATGKTTSEVRNTLRETTNVRGEKMLEEDIPDSVDNRLRGGILLERSASKSSQLRREAQENSSGRRTASPRLNAALPIESSRNGKSRVKNATPVMGTFTEPMDSGPAEFENGDSKSKRAVRPRIKDHHGLHDSLSPKGLPNKRQHKKNGSYSISEVLSMKRNASQSQAEDTPTSDPSRRNAASRTNSRSTKNNGDRDASSTPKIGATADLVDEPDSLPESAEEISAPVRPVPRRQASRTTSTTKLDVKPPGSSRVSAANLVTKTEATRNEPEDEPELGSPGPEEENDVADVPELVADEVDGSEEEIDPNEARYCYCNGVSYGEMVACDNDDCAREWFHLECTGLRSLPPARSTWYCDECKAMLK